MLDDFGLTENGYNVPQSSDVENAMKEDLNTIRASTKLSAILSRLVEIVSKITQKLYETCANVLNCITIKNASGEYLEDLCTHSMITRYTESYSSVVETLTGDNNTTVPAGHQIQNINTNDIFTNNEDIQITNNKCYSVKIGINDVVEGNVYKIQINLSNFEYTASNGDSANDVLEALKTSINAVIEEDKKVDATITDNLLFIKCLNYDDYVTCNIIGEMYFDEVSSLGNYYAIEFGEINVDAGSITKIVDQLSGLRSVINNKIGLLGRDRETDQELRNRLENQENVILSKGTNEGIKTALNNSNIISGTRCYSCEDVVVATVDNIKIYKTKCIVGGGDNNEIAQVIWDYKPSGAEFIGGTQGTAKDDDGLEHIIYFERPIASYMWIKVFVKTEEQTEEMSQRIKQAVIDNYILKSTDEKKIVPIYITGAVTGSIAGLSDVSTQISKTYSPNDTPTYSEDIITLSSSEYAMFDGARVSIVFVNDN